MNPVPGKTGLSRRAATLTIVVVGCQSDKSPLPEPDAEDGQTIQDADSRLPDGTIVESDHLDDESDGTIRGDGTCETNEGRTACPEDCGIDCLACCGRFG